MTAYTVSHTDVNLSPENTSIPCTDGWRATNNGKRGAYVNVQELAFGVLKEEWQTVAQITRAINENRTDRISDRAAGSALKALATRHAIMQRRARVYVGKDKNARLINVYRTRPAMENAA